MLTRPLRAATVLQLGQQSWTKAVEKVLVGHEDGDAVLQLQSLEVARHVPERLDDLLSIQVEARLAVCAVGQIEQERLDRRAVGLVMALRVEPRPCALVANLEGRRRLHDAL